MSLTLISRVLSSAFILCSAAVVAAQEPGSLFAGERVLYEKKNDNQIYRLTLSPLRKINREFVGEREILINGRLRGKTVELSEVYSFETAWAEIQAYYKNLDFTLVYECRSFDCGSSNAWANERFHVKQLYGMDSLQRYQVWQHRHQAGIRIDAVYFVERGNKRVYFQQDQLLSNDTSLRFPPSEKLLAQRFYGDRSIEIGGLNFEDDTLEFDSEALKVYAEVFNQQPFRRLIVVAYYAGTTEKNSAQERAEYYAQKLKDALVSQGVQARRLEIRGELQEQGAQTRAVVYIK